MEAREYAILASLDTDHWWFRGIHSVLLDRLGEIDLTGNICILEAGCGTGGLIRKLRDFSSSRTVGFDVSEHAAAYWPEEDSALGCIASINRIPFGTGVFDVVISVDVLESAGVDPEIAMAELSRVTKTGGWLLLIVPAYRWMLGDAHHEAVHAVRRFSRFGIAALAERHGMRTIRSTNFFASLFPAIALHRLCSKLVSKGRTGGGSDLKQPPRWINRLLTAVVTIEAALLRHIDIPFGTSILLLARKHPS